METATLSGVLVNCESRVIKVCRQCGINKCIHHALQQTKIG